MRRSSFPLPFAALFLAGAGLASSESARAAEAPTSGQVGSDGLAKAAAVKKVVGKTPRRRPGGGRTVKVRGHAVYEAQLRALPPAAPSGDLHLVNIAAHETLRVNIHNDDGSYNNDALKQVSHLLRCKRTGEVLSIEPRLLTVLSLVYDHYQRPIEIVSAYRNQRRTTSHHFRGSASDIRIAGVSAMKLRRFVESLDAGGMGIGYYPSVGFVHVDIRPPPSYRWVDTARENPDSPDKRPPRGWKSKKLRS